MPRTGLLVLNTKTGQPFKKRWFSEQWGEATIAAELFDLHFHDLRGTAVTMLSEAGNTPQQIATVTGDTIKTIHQIIDLARDATLSDAAILNFENSPRTKFANQLQTVAYAAANKKRETQCQTMTSMARPEKFEPPTPRFVVWGEMTTIPDIR